MIAAAAVSTPTQPDAKVVARRESQTLEHAVERRRQVRVAGYRSTVDRAQSRPCSSAKAAITSKIKHAIKHKTSSARLLQLLHNYCNPHWYFVLACSQ